MRWDTKSSCFDGNKLVSFSLPCPLVGLVVKASAPRAEDPEFESRLHRDVFGVESHP